jgi:dTDP-4-amino-4,6-dideoxygalactose transaminase
MTGAGVSADHLVTSVAGTPAPITFNRPYATGREFDYIRSAIDNLHLSGNGEFTRRCAAWLEQRIGCQRALLTFSCTSALEMAAILAGLGPGDEVIMPSFTFVSTASAVALRGAVPVFVDIRADTLNLDERLIEEAVTARTKAILPVHYAGVACEMNAIAAIAERHGLLVIEDAAQGICATYGGRPLGGIGQLGCLSFHETKNVMCGEGGALLINTVEAVERAEILQEKGTNRSQFFRGEVDKYTWVELGSSFLTSEINAAFLWAQFEAADEILTRRLAIWERYHEALAELERHGRLRRPIVPDGCGHNAHMYYLLLEDRRCRDDLIESLRRLSIQAVFHYIPLHSSPAGLRYGRASGTLAVTDGASERLVRLPLWVEMSDADVDRVAAAVYDALA